MLATPSEEVISGPYIAWPISAIYTGQNFGKQYISWKDLGNMHLVSFSTISMSHDVFHLCRIFSAIQIPHDQCSATIYIQRYLWQCKSGTTLPTPYSDMYFSKVSQLWYPLLYLLSYPSSHHSWLTRVFKRVLSEIAGNVYKVPSLATVIQWATSGSLHTRRYTPAPYKRKVSATYVDLYFSLYIVPLILGKVYHSFCSAIYMGLCNS